MTSGPIFIYKRSMRVFGADMGKIWDSIKFGAQITAIVCTAGILQVAHDVYRDSKKRV